MSDAKISVDEALKALQMFLEALEGLEASLNERGAQAFQDGNHGLAEEYLKKVRSLSPLREDVSVLGRKLQALLDKPIPVKAAKPAERQMSHGDRTPLSAYSVPILRALVEMGGRARRPLVMDRVYEQMRDTFTEADLELSSGKTPQPRWQGVLQNCRERMRQDGLIVDGTRGWWEISDKGRAWLAEQER